MKQGRTLLQRYGIPLSVLVMGATAFVLLLWARGITERQRASFAHIDAVEHIQIKTANFHLWFEEAIAHGTEDKVKASFRHLEDAEALTHALLHGGALENGLDIPPLHDPWLRSQAEHITGHLAELREAAEIRQGNPRLGGIGSSLDDRFNAIYGQFERVAEQLEKRLEESLATQLDRTRNLLYGILAVWALVVAASTAGLHAYGLRRRRAESALAEAYEEMEDKVMTRTGELRRANLLLRQEIAEKTQLRAESMRAAQLASVGELAAGVAHEINNPINSVINFAQILCNKTAPGSMEQDVAERIKKEGHRIADIVRALLSFARQRKRGKVATSVGEVLSESLALTQSQMRKEGVRVITAVPPDLPDIVADPQQIQQVFMNVISNARYALNQRYDGSHENKMIEITGETADVDGGPHVRITFHDRGAGIPDGTINRVMEPFFSTKPSGKGTGLGLSISRDIIADHGGSMSIESRQGDFTKVTIELPAKEGADG